MNPKPSKRQRFKNFILRRKLNTLGLLVITLMSGLITIACAVRGFSHTDILILVTALLGDGASARAVGGAVGRNPISIIVPCHRVIGADGSLTGYAGGVDRKIRLLALERQGTKRR